MKLEYPYKATEVFLNGPHSRIENTWLCGICLREMFDLKHQASSAGDYVQNAHVCVNRHCKQAGFVFIKPKD